MALRMFNTLGREVQEIVPIEKNRIKMYACGPTVYRFAHIGNLRTYLMEDILKRVLELSGCAVTYVMNITDVGHLTDDADAGEDKMLKGAREQGKSVWDIAEFYAKVFFEDMEVLNIRKPDIICKATEHIEDMISLIQRIEENGYTYFSGGNLYFDISSFPGYRKLALLDLSELKAGNRITVDKNKKNPHDFVLWFTQSKFKQQVMLWDSPWGKGYPGWHIECSAMSMKYLGEQFDIHCGGIDLIPVHHTNEIAQSEAATGKKWVNYWIHGEFLNTPKGKMSKSAGNFHTLKDLTGIGYSPLDYRYFCLLGHYRSQLQFSIDALDSARNARKNLCLRIALLRQEGENDNYKGDGEEVNYYASFKSHAYDDLNMPQCLSDLWNLVKDPALPSPVKLKVIGKMDAVLGLDLEKAEIDTNIDDEIKRLIEKRELARKMKDFTQADSIRDELKHIGIILEDTPDGVRWRKI